MIVVDASVVLAALLSAAGGGAQARERLRRDTDLHAPHLLDVEVLAALRRRVRLGHTPAERADDVLADLRDLAVLRWDHEPLSRRAWALRESVTAYDGVYVALAEALEATFVTADARLAGAPGLSCPVELLAD
ncbi:MAG: type II toxin-antitoxin system VapC family toxin [Geodermatophilaceae bacterium]|nr:type II toxin-antitoxin system VapC family toxin [Geodermatophilaceae bacterium]MDQ3455272.1 type II toxin-antitoxin system VapC family toxin [Actinomycetota bacterium]